ncbi:amidohydrolase family protein [Idiomarina abyssalis]|uniref:amidohydrolase family protein n=1 Tax=Idiomarina abyssalis TaxID=86102 RepID=UPI001CD58C43|nr:amidohydrolase family protein [Idiomarina abyssalis]
MKKLWLLLALAITAPTLANDFVINNVLLPDFETRELTPVNIEVVDGKFKQIVDSSVPLSHTNVRDGKGQVIMPAFIDMHSHSMGNSSLDRSDYQYIGIRGTANAMLYAGVHGWLDLYSDEEDIFEYRDQQFPEERDEAYVFAAGPCFTVPTGHCDFGETRLISTPDEAVLELRDLSPAKPDVVKIVFDNAGSKPTVDEATLEAFLNEARSLNIKSVVHIGSWSDIRTASELGADAVTHLPWHTMPEDIPELLVKQGTVIIPTVSVINELLHLHDASSDELSASVLSVTMTDALVEEDLLNDYPITAENKVYFDWIAGLKEDGALANRKDAIKRLDAAGVTILVGSDGGNFAVFQGVGFHREMYFLQQMGMSPWDIVLGSTYSAYDFLDVDWGIKEDRPANFTLHHRRIFEDLGLSAKVKAIYLNGRWVQREPLLDYATPDFFQYIKLFFGFEV